MNLLLSDTFSTSLGKLTPDEQKATKLTVVDFQLKPERSGETPLEEFFFTSRVKPRWRVDAG